MMQRLTRLWRTSRSDLGLLWFALRHPARPVWLLPVVGLMALYAIEPANFALPPLGVVDDLVVLPLVLHAILRLLPGTIRASFDGVQAPRADEVVG